MLLFFLNLILIYLCALFIFWVKDIRPPMPDPGLSKFLEDENPLRVNDGDDDGDGNIPLMSERLL